MAERYIIGIDQSTQGTKAIVYSPEGKMLARADKPHRQIIDNRGYVEHDPMEIYRNTVEVVRNAVASAGIDKDEVAAIGISNQRETVAGWNRETGEPVYNAIVWQCGRAEQICRELDKDGFADRVYQVTGLTLSPFFSGPKAAWIMRNVPEARELAAEGKLCFGTMDAWLLFRLTGGKSFRTDCSNASRYMLMDLEKLEWDRALCEAFGIPADSLPEICYSDSCFGTTDLEGFFSHPVEIHCMMGDSHGALFGQGCHAPGMIKATYGTGSSIMLNVGDTIARCEGIASSVGWGENGKAVYVLEGNINYSCMVITWLKDSLGLLENAKDSGRLAALANPEDTTCLVPAFSGLGAPHWDSDARATICFMSRTTGKNEIVRAAEDGIAHQIADVVGVMSEKSGIEIGELRVDGGATKDKYLMQFQRDMLNSPIQVAEIEELSATGVAYMAGIARGLYDREKVFANISRSPYYPSMDAETRKAKRELWAKAVATVLTKK